MIFKEKLNSVKKKFNVHLSMGDNEERRRCAQERNITT